VTSLVSLHSFIHSSAPVAPGVGERAESEGRLTIVDAPKSPLDHFSGFSVAHLSHQEHKNNISSLVLHEGFDEMLDGGFAIRYLKIIFHTTTCQKLE
jgi:hypothetical protein